MTVRLALTPGEPAGIGPDLVVSLAQTSLDCEWVCFSNAELLHQRAQQLGLTIYTSTFDPQKPPMPNEKGQIKLVELPLAKPAIAGQLDKNNAQFVLACITEATQACLAGNFAALVTGPIHKGIINDAGIAFSGHTEFLQALSKCDKVVMMLANNIMRVALATTHLPLKEVPAALHKNELIKTITILHQSLQSHFNIKQPHILIAGLNPHAGESGHMGDEELTTITPAIEYCQQQGLHLSGPLPADTLFTEKYLTDANAVLAMYHDQGLPVLKYAGFGTSVNITLGLPFIRTSVDHGTALGLAGSGEASNESLKSAIQQAMIMAAHHAQGA